MFVPNLILNERGLDRAQYFILNKMPFFGRKSVNTNVSLSAAPKLALVPASRYYCDVNWAYLNVCATFH